MQNLYFSVIFFYYGLVAATILGLLLTSEWFLSEKQTPRLLNYSTEQYVYAVIPGLINYVAYSSQTIAMQNDSPAFVALLAYIGLVYSFFGDIIVFKAEIKGLQLVGIALIFMMNVWVSIEKF